MVGSEGPRVDSEILAFAERTALRGPQECPAVEILRFRMPTILHVKPFIKPLKIFKGNLKVFKGL